MPIAASEGYIAARERTALFMQERGLIVVSGKDRASYLQGLLTNDIVALQAGHGCYSAYLTPQGRMIADLHVYELGDVILLVLPLQVKDTVLARLDQFIFAEDVQLGDVTGTFGMVSLVGRESVRVLAGTIKVDPSQLEALAEHGNRRLDIDGETVIVLRAGDAGVPGFHVLAPPDRVQALVEGFRAEGAVAIDPETVDLLRIEGGVPLFGRDMDEETIPLEAGIEQQAISFSKGCYVGQEVIIRVLHRGHGRVARRLVGILFDDGVEQPPGAGETLAVDGREVGSITSAALSPARGRAIALGYVKRDFAAPGTVVVAASGARGEVAGLPFVG
jgi:folate-binding protein YgfZ